MNHRREVVITGLGVAAANGIGIPEFWKNCLAGPGPVEPIPDHWRQFHDFRSGVWSPLPEIDYEARGIRRPELLSLDPVSSLGIFTALEALEQAGIGIQAVDRKATRFRLEDTDPQRGGVFVGTGIGGAHTFLATHAHHLLSRPSKVLDSLSSDGGLEPRVSEAVTGLKNNWVFPNRYNPFVVSMLMPNAVSAVIGIRFGIRGINRTISLACASGTAAIGQAYRAIHNGEIDIALAGGCEYLNDHYGHIFRGFDVAGTLTRWPGAAAAASRPFDAQRSGFLFSEGGSAMLVLEAHDHAERRRARPLARIAGYAETFDAHSIMSLEADGTEIERMIRAALDEARVAPGDVDYINAHGTGTELNDATEAALIDRVFGAGPLVNSSKSIIGHSIGASGAIEAAVACLSLADNLVHPSYNIETPVDGPRFARSIEERELNTVLSQSFAFGGHNAALVFGKLQ